ncbi:MAG: Uma2 family endonuclease [Planctomycetales bacterium]|nr:Uma2 family endonuclease [Planctomycetales bacterium]
MTHITADQLAMIPSQGKRFELVRGVLKMMAPAGGRHGQIAMRIGSMLEQYVREHQLGVVFAAETGFLLSCNPDTVRAPDAAFASHETLKEVDTLEGYVPVAPDLVIEVVSQYDASSEVESNARMWLDAGTRLVLVVDPNTETIRAYRDPSTIEVRCAGEILDASQVVKGWILQVDDVIRP